MLTPRIRAALVVLAASAGLSACTSFGPYGGVGVGGGYGSYGYDPYYSGYGYGSPYGYAGYGSQYGYGYDPFGWYNGYYYPGSGNYCYDRDHHRRELTAEERAYWNARIQEHVRAKWGLNGTTGTTAVAKENWSGFNRPSGATGDTNATATAGTTNREAFRQHMLERQQAQQQARVERQQVQSERQQTRSERVEARQQSINERQEARRVRRGSSDD